MENGRIVILVLITALLALVVGLMAGARIAERQQKFLNQGCFQNLPAEKSAEDLPRNYL